MGEVQGQGYIGQALGYADVLGTAFAHIMNFRPDEPEWEERDRFLLSHGHYAIAYYAALIEAGSLPRKSWKPTALMTAACRCLAWPPTPRQWKCPAVRWARD
jgi:transketolase N-terminal domain/subunit